MEEQQINLVINRIYGNPLLTVKESKICPHFLNEKLYLGKNCHFEIFLREYIRKPKHIKKVTAAKYKVGQ